MIIANDLIFEIKVCNKKLYQCAKFQFYSTKLFTDKKLPKIFNFSSIYD